MKLSLATKVQCDVFTMKFQEQHSEQNLSIKNKI